MCRASAADSCSAHGDGLPDGLWGYNFDDAVDCIALTPDPDDPSHICPLSKQLGGREVTVSHRRAWGCVVYPHLDVTQRDTRSKTAPNSVRCVLMGYRGSASGAFEQLGYGRLPGEGPSGAIVHEQGVGENRATPV